MNGSRSYKRIWHILDEEYSLKFVTKLPEEELQPEYQHFGTCSPATKIIKIKKGLTRFEIMNTFLHEIGHGFENEYDKEVCHDTLEFMAKAFTHLLCNNWDGFKQIMDGPNGRRGHVHRDAEATEQSEETKTST